VNGPGPVHPRRSTSWHAARRRERPSWRVAFAQGLTESISSRLHQIRDRAGWAAGGAGRPVPTANLLGPTCRLARPRSVGLPAWVVLAGVAPRPATSRRWSWRGPAQRPSAGVAPSVRGHRGCREEAVAPAKGRPALASSSEGSGDREQAQAANPDQRRWGDLAELG
jgi:hypothetical protein